MLLRQRRQRSSMTKFLALEYRRIVSGHGCQRRAFSNRRHPSLGGDLSRDLFRRFRVGHYFAETLSVADLQLDRP